MEKILEEIDKLVSSIQSKEVPLEKLKSFDEQLQNDITFHSNKIEGNTLTYGETLKVIAGEIAPKGKPLKDSVEILNHKKVIQTLFKEFNSIELNSDTLLNIHRDLMKDPIMWGFDLNEAGKFKGLDNYTILSSGKQHKYESPAEVPGLIKNLFDHTSKRLETKSDHPLIIASDFQAKALAIHPFSDGNGRAIRLCSDVILMKEGHSPILPPSDKKTTYIKALEMYQHENKPKPYHKFMATQLLEITKKKAKLFNGKSKGKGF